MIEMKDWKFDGTEVEIFARSWRDGATIPRFVAVLVHGYGEHIGRYDQVAQALVEHRGVVYGLDHMGHGQSGGERALIPDFEPVVADVHTLVEQARTDWPDLPVVLIGHSMGGMIGARYAQEHGDVLDAVVLSGAAVGNFDTIGVLLSLDEIPDVPLDPEVLSRDPAVGEAYAADPLVWHGAFKRPTLQGFADTIAAITADGPLDDLPLLWVHGEDDQLVPIEGTRAGIERLGGDTFEQHTYPGGRHEVFNETNGDEVIADVIDFIERVLPD